MVQLFFSNSLKDLVRKILSKITGTPAETMDTSSVVYRSLRDQSVSPGAHYPEPPYQLYSWVNPVLYLFIFRTEIRGGFFNFPRKHADVRITPEKKLRPKAKANLYSFSACDVNNIGPQLSYDWLLCKHPRKTPWEVLLKIKCGPVEPLKPAWSFEWLPPIKMCHAVCAIELF